MRYNYFSQLTTGKNIMQNNPSIGHMMMAVACIIFIGVIAQANGHASWVDVYRTTTGAVAVSVLSRMFAGFE